MPRFYFPRGFRLTEAWIGSAHELLWNFLPANSALKISHRARIASSIYKGCRTNEVKKKNFCARN